jgi:hypothetical protein
MEGQDQQNKQLDQIHELSAKISRQNFGDKSPE